jgi:hypothetical protein
MILKFCKNAPGNFFKRRDAAYQREEPIERLKNAQFREAIGRFSALLSSVRWYKSEVNGCVMFRPGLLSTVESAAFSPSLWTLPGIDATTKFAALERLSRLENAHEVIVMVSVRRAIFLLLGVQTEPPAKLSEN